MAAGQPAGQNGVDIEESTQRLHVAARNGATEKARAAIVVGGAKIDDLDPWGLTPLHSAALKGHLLVMSLLTEQKADINARTSRGQTPMHLAVTEGHEAAIKLLIDQRADVALKSSHGTTALELAAGKPNCHKLICDELTRRWVQADNDIVDLQSRLEAAYAARSLMQSQLGDFMPEGLAAASKGTTAPPSPAKSTAAPDSPGSSPKATAKPLAVTQQLEGPAHYWRSAAVAVADMRGREEEALERSLLRAPPVVQDPFSWSGKLVTTGVLPVVDPDDKGLIRCFNQLQLSADENARREARRLATTGVQKLPQTEKHEGLADLLPTRKYSAMPRVASRPNTPGGEPNPQEDAAPPAQEGVTSSVDASNVRLLEVSNSELHEGRSMAEWDALVDRLQRPEGEWDWSRVQVRERASLHGLQDTQIGPLTGAYAAAEDQAGVLAPEYVDPGSKPVFVTDEVIGPLGGIVRRRTRYEELHYPASKWVLHDAFGYQMTLRALTIDLKLEPLVLDLAAGDSQNRLRHLTDVRRDPLGLAELFAGPLKPAPAEPLLPPRRYSAMPRVRSRPNSPSRDGEPVPQEGAASPADEGVTSSPETPNVKLVEVRVKGWPYVFAVAARDIWLGEELTVDRGEGYWESQRSALMRLRDLSHLCREMVAGVDMEERPGSKEFTRGQRKPMKRAASGMI